MTPSLFLLGAAGLLAGVALVVHRWWFAFVGCPHSRVRCVHGDEITGRRGRRAACEDCGRSLDRPLPDPCSFTGEPHPRGGR